MNPGGHKESPYGAVFNVEFSPRGDFVVAACEARAVVVYDPRYNFKVHAIPHAHEDCVNCVTFLDDTLFATCSDDHTIRLWDFRNLRSRLGILTGHTNWVKNIEYDRNSGYLFSVAFQDGVRFWDLNNLDAYSGHQGEYNNRVQTLQDPVRMRLSPDGSKMFVSSRRNQCLLISDFDGKRLGEVEDLYGRFQQRPQDQTIQTEAQSLSCNKPSLHVMCSTWRGHRKRVVMSMVFHPSGQLLGLRHVDVKGEEFQHELLSLFALQTTYSPYLSVEDLQSQYLKFVDEYSSDDSNDFIKEICFSRDGRVLASPHGNGVRLLSVDSACTPMDIYYSESFFSEQKNDMCPNFEELCVTSGHSAPVLTCKFAHHDLILASGSLNGSVAFSTPQL